MELTGIIIDVMESMPPQLFVECDSRKYAVSLDNDARIERKGHPAGIDFLVPGAKIRLIGESSGTDAMCADFIEVLS